MKNIYTLNKIQSTRMYLKKGQYVSADNQLEIIENEITEMERNF